jgi:large subunit ribosomal protein L11
MSSGALTEITYFKNPEPYAILPSPLHPGVPRRRKIQNIAIMATKKVKTVVKINLKAGEATPAPPVGTALGQHGVAIMDFVKAYNDKTSSMRGNVVPAVITIYEDRSFDFEIKMAPVSELIKKKIGLDKGSGAPNRQSVGTLSDSQLTEIAQEKMVDLNTTDLDAAKKVVAGTARSMGVKVE